MRLNPGHQITCYVVGELLACAYLNDHVRLLKRYHVKCLMPTLFLPPEFAYQSIPDTELSYTFLRRWHP